jgi:hypothetical protein
VSEGDRILYSDLSKPFASELGMESRWAARSRDLPAKSVTRRLNAGGKALTEDGGGDLVDEVIGLGRYGKTLTVLSVERRTDAGLKKQL